MNDLDHRELTVAELDAVSGGRSIGERAGPPTLGGALPTPSGAWNTLLGNYGFA